MHLAFILLLSILVLFPFSARLEGASSPHSPVVKEQWKGIYVGQEKIGFSHLKDVRLGNKTEIEEEMNFKMMTMGTRQDIHIASRYALDGYSLQSFNFEMDTGVLKLSASGKRVGDTMKVEVHSISGKTTLTYAISDDTIIPPMLDSWLFEKNPKVGDSFRVRIFDPSSVLTGTPPERMVAEVAVTGKERISIPLGEFDALRVEVALNGANSTAWINESGQTIKEIADPGLVTLLETKEDALKKAASGIDIVAMTAIRSNVTLSNPTKLRYMRLKIYGISSLDGLDLNDDNRQTFKNGMLEIRLNSLDRLKSYNIPYRGKGDEPERYLEPTALIQSNSPELIKAVQRVLDGERDSLAATKKLVDWTYRYLEKVPTVSIPNALDVLKTKRGDCNEHATLFAGLSRAAGIPTKVVLGLVYLSGKFYYHAWNEVYIGKWVAVDSTFGQFPADASHIKLIEGDIAKGSDILKLVGKLKLEIVEAS